MPVIGLAFYLLPTIIVVIRKKPNALKIVLINIFLGWTFIGWVIAIIQSLQKDNPVTPANVTIENENVSPQYSYSDAEVKNYVQSLTGFPELDDKGMKPVALFAGLLLLRFMKPATVVNLITISLLLWVPFDQPSDLYC